MLKSGKKSSFIPRKALPIPSLTLLLPLSQESYSFFAPSNPTPPSRSLETRGDRGGRQDGLCYLSIIKQWWRAEGYRFLFRILTVLVRTQHFQLIWKAFPKGRIKFHIKRRNGSKCSSYTYLKNTWLQLWTTRLLTLRKAPQRDSPVVSKKKTRERMKEKEKNKTAWKVCSLIWVHQDEQWRLHKAGRH